MMDLEKFRDGLRALVGSDPPECISLVDYRVGLAVLWQQNPARAFLRLTDADQAKVWQLILENQRGQN